MTNKTMKFLLVLVLSIITMGSLIATSNAADQPTTKPILGNYFFCENELGKGRFMAAGRLVIAPRQDGNGEIRYDVSVSIYRAVYPNIALLEGGRRGMKVLLYPDFDGIELDGGTLFGREFFRHESLALRQGPNGVIAIIHGFEGARFNCKQYPGKFD